MFFTFVCAAASCMTVRTVVLCLKNVISAKELLLTTVMFCCCYFVMIYMVCWKQLWQNPLLITAFAIICFSLHLFLWVMAIDLIWKTNSLFAIQDLQCQLSCATVHWTFKQIVLDRILFAALCLCVFRSLLFALFSALRQISVERGAFEKVLKWHHNRMSCSVF